MMVYPALCLIFILLLGEWFCLLTLLWVPLVGWDFFSCEMLCGSGALNWDICGISVFFSIFLILNSPQEWVHQYM